MSEVRIRALEAAVQSLRERNEILEDDRKLLGTRAAELEDRLLRTQRELDKVSKSAAVPARRSVVSRVKRKIARQRVVASLRRSTRQRTERRQPPPASSPGHRTGPPSQPPGGRSAAPATHGADAPIEVAERLPSRPQARRLRVLGVLDTMSAECFGESVDLTLPEPAHIAETVRDGQFDLVLVESAWQGNAGSWQFHVGSYVKTGYRGIPALRQLVDAARACGVPTAFWNKEDPVHFVKFSEAARIFDIVFTTDSDRIGAYYALQGQAQVVDALQFSAQPSLHNPLGGAHRAQSAVFAGTFYQKRHVARQGSLRMLLEAAKPHGLVIYDRKHGSGDAGYDFPDTVADNVLGSLPYAELVHEYRRHKVFLNTNSVTASPTMFSRRVFELLACGTPVVSTPSRGMETTFGALVDSVESASDAAHALERLMTDEAYWLRRSHDGIREVMLNHTYAHRLGQIARAAGLEPPSAGPSVALLCLTDDDLGHVARLGAQLAGIREIAVPVEMAGESVSAATKDTSIDRVVRFDLVSGDLRKSQASAADRVAAEWVIPVAELRGLEPAAVTDLAIATMFSPQRRVVARPGAAFDDCFGVVVVEPGEPTARRTVDVAHGTDADTALLAWVG